jgi:hypothetical protein
MADPDAPMGQGLAMAEEALCMLREVRDNTAPSGDSAPKVFPLRRAIGIDIVAGTGLSQIRVRAGVAWELESLTLESPGLGGQLLIYVSNEGPETLLEVIDLPGAMIAGQTVARLSHPIIGGQYVPENTDLFFRTVGVGTDGRLVMSLRGNVRQRPHEPMTTHSSGM